MDESQEYERLVRGGIAPRRARRALREFAEHRSDIVRERLALGESAAQSALAADARLGTPGALVDRMLACPELKSWYRRRPWLAFAVAPVAAFCALFVGLSLAILGAVSGYKASWGDLHAAPGLLQGISTCIGNAATWGIPIVVSGAIALVAIRRRESSLWPTAGVLLICMIGGCTNFDLMLPSISASPGLTIGIGFSTAAPAPPLSRAAAIAFVTLLPYLWARRHAAGRTARTME
jgi:hypothetical protein